LDANFTSDASFSTAFGVGGAKAALAAQEAPQEFRASFRTFRESFLDRREEAVAMRLSFWGAGAEAKDDLDEEEDDEEDDDELLDRVIFCLLLDDFLAPALAEESRLDLIRIFGLS